MKAIERRLTRLEHAAMPMNDEPTQIVVEYIEPDGSVADSYTLMTPSLALGPWDRGSIRTRFAGEKR